MCEKWIDDNVVPEDIYFLLDSIEKYPIGTKKDIGSFI